ncbi:MAG: hypothetical protein U9Q27_02120 [Patescibacteria group bacterium]|nr:hypothetical protein [Patescibacteria group bacterium]
MNKIILFFILIAVAIGSVGFWYYQKNFYSKESVKLEILGPETTEMAEEIEYIVKYKNNGNIRVENPLLIFEYPKGSIIENENQLRQTFGEKELGNAIYPGEEKIFKFKARLMGKENETKTAKAWLSYRPKNLKAKYESETSFTTQITKVPLTFEFDLPTKIEANKEIKFRLNYFSISEYPLSDLTIKIEYPNDFEFIESSPKALENIEWNINSLNKTQGGRIEILGKLFGNTGEQKLFKAKLGIWENGEFTLLKQIFKGVEIIEPSIFVSQQINNNPEYVANLGDLLHYEIFFKNIGEKALTNLFLVAKLEGKAYDFQSIKAPYGDFNTGDNSIIFDWKKIPELRFLDGYEEGVVEFWINLKSEIDVENSKNRNLCVKNKIYLSEQYEFITKINTRIGTKQTAFYEDEVFGNTGAIPPKINEPTTYTVMWNLKNYYNDIKNAKIKAILPPTVELTGKIFPEEQETKLAFDSLSREIVWEIGELSAGQGILQELDSPNIAFQIKFIPDSSQTGQIAELISATEFSAEDIFTGQILSASNPAISSDLPDDETISEKQGIIEE